MKTKSISTFLVFVVLSLSFTPRAIYAQTIYQSKSDSVMSSKQITLGNKSVKKINRSIVFSSIAASALLGLGTMFLIDASKKDQEAINLYPVSAVSNSSSDWRNDLRYQYKTYDDYLRSVDYSNSVRQSHKNDLLKQANTSKIMGLVSYTGSSIFALNVIFKFSEKNKISYSIK